jgi:hypothetical protein
MRAHARKHAHTRTLMHTHPRTHTHERAHGAVAHQVFMHDQFGAGGQGGDSEYSQGVL